jgi:hypothetical protein
VLIFATSDKGGTGRSVTTANVAYRRALMNTEVAYFDFDFGSPTAGTIFSIDGVERGTTEGGMHRYLAGRIEQPHRVDVWRSSDRDSLRGQPDRAGALDLYPGDKGGGEFPANPDAIKRCVNLLLRAEQQYEISLIDLSAGRSHATEIVLAATASPQLAGVTARWLVFHRWTRQHIVAAEGLVTGAGGLLDTGARWGHDKAKLAEAIRFVRTAVVDPSSEELAGLRAEQVAWLRDTNKRLQQLASEAGVGRRKLLGSVPLDPVLQWREQLITDWDTTIRQIANQATVDAFEEIARRVGDDHAWGGL